MTALAEIQLNFDFLFQRSLESTRPNQLHPSQYEANYQFDRILKDIFTNSKYRGEQYKYTLAFSTEIEYKQSTTFKTYRLILQGSKFVVLNTIAIPSKPNEEANLKAEPKKAEDIYHPIVNLDFNLLTANVTINKQGGSVFSIYILGSKQVFKFRIVNKEIFERTIFFINTAIKFSNGFKTNIIGISLRHNFYKNYFITERDFREKAKTGDMLLFRGFEFPAVCQRCFTGAMYDHVALLQKTNNMLYVYESTSKDGCKKRQWRDFTYNLWNLLYDRMVYRELIIDTDSKENKDKMKKEIETKADEYLNQTQGKNYSLSFCSIICGSSKQTFEENNEWDKSPGFSCSALLTGAYVKMGIIKYFADSRSILPGKYAQDSKLPFNPPFSLGPEHIIDFSS